MIREYKELRKFRINRHSSRQLKAHTKRFETTLTTFDGASSASHHCSRSALRNTSTSYDRHGPNYRAKISTEAPCQKCGWKILYTEAYKNTEQGWGKRDYYYHLECYKK